MTRIRRNYSFVHWVLFIGICVLAVVFRVLALSRESLWFDEGMSWWLASLAPLEMLRVIRGDVAAPFYFVLLHGWVRLFGDSDVAMRSLSAVCSILTLVPFYLLARRTLLSRGAMLLACLLMAGSFMQVQFAREARYYALLALLTMTALACVPTLGQRRSWPAMALFAACCVLGLYTHNVMAFIGGGLCAAWLFWPGERATRARAFDLTIAGGIVLLAYLPWLPVLIEQMRWMTGTFWAERPDVAAIAVSLSAIGGVDIYAVPAVAWERLGHGISAGQVMVIAPLALLSAVAIAATAREPGPRRAALALIAFAFAPVALVFIYSQFRQPIFMERIFIASSAVTPILLAMSVDRGRPVLLRVAGALATALLIALCAPSLLGLLTHTQKEDWRGAYAMVSQLPPSDRRLLVFVANEGELPFAYYAAHDPSRHAEPRTGAPAGFFDLDPPKTIRRVLSGTDLAPLRVRMDAEKWDEIVLVLGHEAFADPRGLTELELRRRWRLLDERLLWKVRVLRFVRPID